jgi:hypothetical protein
MPRADGVRQFADEVTARVPAGAPGVLDFGRPEAVAVVVLRHEHDVAGAGSLKEIGPGVGVEGFAGVVEFGAEGRVRTIAVGCLVMRRSQASGEARRIFVPLGVGDVRVHVVVVVAHQVMDRAAARRPSRDREDAPVYEDAEARDAEPFRAGAVLECVKCRHFRSTR